MTSGSMETWMHSISIAALPHESETVMGVSLKYFSFNKQKTSELGMESTANRWGKLSFV